MCNHEGGFDCFDWKDIGLVAALADEISHEDLKRQRLLEKAQPEEDENF